MGWGFSLDCVLLPLLLNLNHLVLQSHFYFVLHMFDVSIDILT